MSGVALAGDFQKGKVRFGVPPWPGVTMKSEVASQLFDAIGYETSKQQVGLSFVYNALENRDLDVFLANWSPSQDGKIEPYLEKGSIVRLSRNIDDALWGMAVPAYVYEAGVRSVGDLDKYGDRFNREVHGIEPGSGVNQQYNKAISNDTEGLGDWELVASSTAGMLSAVERAAKRDEWIVFNGWKPHWMFAVHDLRILKDPSNTGLSDKKTDVYTLVPEGYSEFDPNAARFLEQMKVGSAIQSKWILEHSYNKRDESEVASEWISNNLDTVEVWMEGVETMNGEPAMDAVRAAF
jgi:glycine betaine/proline transport system substrate-binding protein